MLIGALLLFPNFKSFPDPFKKPVIVDEYKNESNGVTTIFHIEKLRVSPFWGVGFIVIGLLAILVVKFGLKGKI